MAIDARANFWLKFSELQSSWEDPETSKVYSCIDLYFVAQVNDMCDSVSFTVLLFVNYIFSSDIKWQDGTSFKSKYKFRPYFYAGTKVRD